MAEALSTTHNRGHHGGFGAEEKAQEGKLTLVQKLVQDRAKPVGAAALVMRVCMMRVCMMRGA